MCLRYLSTKGGPFAKQPVPSQFNWDLYQGQAPEHDYCPERTHFNFRWWYEYSGGMITDWGNHHVDIAHWGMDCDLGGPTSVDELKENPLPADAWRAYPATDHMANFFECVKTRKQPCAPVQVEHRTSTACHLTNISLRLKRKLHWDPAAQQIIGDDEANAWQKREQRAPYQIDG